MDEDTDYWAAYFATTIADVLTKPVGLGRTRLREALARYRASPVCTPTLRQLLDGLLDEAVTDPGLNYKPCANPECRAPIPRRSPRIYCDRLCRKIAAEYAEEERKAEHVSLQTEEIPF